MKQFTKSNIRKELEEFRRRANHEGSEAINQLIRDYGLDQEEEEPEEEPKVLPLKTYIWRCMGGVFGDGIVAALAVSKQQARQKIRRRYPGDIEAAIHLNPGLILSKPGAVRKYLCDM